MPAEFPDRDDDHEVAAVGGSLEDTEDLLLVAAGKRGSGYAFEVLVKRHSQRILWVQQRVTGHREDAEDVQQSFQKASVYVQKFEGRSSYSTRLTRIAIHEALMYLRRNRGAGTVSIDELTAREDAAVPLQISDSGPNPSRSYSEQERNQILSLAVNQVETGIRAAIQLCKLDERSLKESAQMMGCPLRPRSHEYSAGEDGCARHSSAASHHMVAGKRPGQTKHLSARDQIKTKRPAGHTKVTWSVVASQPFNLMRLRSWHQRAVAVDASVAASYDQSHPILVRLRFDFDRYILDLRADGLLMPVSSLERDVRGR